jgi:Leucine-rich repeat (LRR) protein
MVRLFGVPSATATPDGLRELRRCEPLESLLLCGEWVQDEHVAAVGELGKLKCLTLLGTPNVTSGVFESAGKLRSLRELYIVDADLVVDEGATHLQYLHELKVLLLAETSISDLTVENLKQLKKLEWLSLAGTQVGDAAMLVLAELPQLQTLDLERTKVGDEGLARLSSHKELRVLSLSETRVTNEGLRAIGLMTQLETLDLWLTSIDDQGLEHLVSLSNLRHLQLGPDISKEAEDRLRRRLPNCTIEVFYTP